MPEEKVDAKPGEGAVPAFDPDKMRTLIREELQQAMSTEGKGDDNYTPPVATARPEATVNPLQAVIDPLIAPHVQRMNLVAEGARDASTFYVTHPEAAKYQAEIEKAFNALMTQGTPFTREAVWDWYRGRNFDKFLQEARASDDQKLQDAKLHSDSTSGTRPAGGPVKDAHSTSDEELKNALSGVSF